MSEGPDKRRWYNLLLAMLFVALGCGFLQFGLAVTADPEIYPSLQLDVVLSQEEIADEDMRDMTLDIMKRVARLKPHPLATFSLVTGFVGSAASMVGIFITIFAIMQPPRPR